MKDIPVFTTENGAASLVLREIPYQGAAYIRLRSSQEPELLLRECVGFCRMAGAKTIFAAGHEMLENYPLSTAIIRMTCSIDSIGDTDAALWPVQAQTADIFQKIYNEKAARIPNAAWMDNTEKMEMLRSGEGYFVHAGETMLGIGRVSGGEIRFLASVHPGAGADVVRALCHAVVGDSVTVEVASANEKAVRLYETLGFVKSAELLRWYKVM